MDFSQAFSRFAHNLALRHEGREITYESLGQMAAAVGARLPARSLVFLETRNHPDAIAAYVACRLGGHAVYLFSDRDKTTPLIDLYRPNAVIDAHGVEVLSRDPIALHPDLRVLLSTSGSTGSAKLVKLSERNLDANAEAIAAYLGITETDCAATSLAFNYSYGMSVVNSHLTAGASLWLTEASTSESGFWEGFRAAGATSLAGVPYSFEVLDRGGEGWAATPGLKAVTQAGGRLAPALVRKMARLGKAHGWRFFVMYGQTEAAPRMAYLPPEQAQEHPDCIGVAIPGGTLFLEDQTGLPVEGTGREGELVYRGPNVMMGYATGPADLAGDETPDSLKTGDIAVRDASGLFRIVGRSARFVKPFGVRLNLDEVEEAVRAQAPSALVTGTDETLVVALTKADAGADTGQIRRTVSAAYGLPAFAVEVKRIAEVPLLANGKVDYRALTVKPVKKAPPRGPLAVLSLDYVKAVAFEAGKILGLAEDDWTSVRQIFETFVSAKGVTGASTFTGLAGDSLTYVQTHLALESYLGAVPDDWESLTVDQLEGMGGHEASV
ncbi:hypothetical protein BH11PSE2_BH11PSE2_09790 [soil metagenome]